MLMSSPGNDFRLPRPGFNDCFGGNGAIVLGAKEKNERENRCLGIKHYQVARTIAAA
jgi:hypothetical protein